MTSPPESAWGKQAQPHHGSLAAVACSVVWIQTYYYQSPAVSIANKIIHGISQSHIHRFELSSLQEEALEEEMATHASILAWRIPWTEEPGRLQSRRSNRVGHAWSNLAWHEEEACSGIHSLKAASFLAKVTVLILTELFPWSFFTHQMGNSAYTRHLTVLFCFLKEESVRWYNGYQRSWSILTDLENKLTAAGGKDAGMG